jgi:hypothetical protein
MRNLNELDQYRMRAADTYQVFGHPGDENSGAFRMASCMDGSILVIIASNDAGWDHVSVSRKNRAPNWFEMEQVKKAFFAEDEVAWQYHVPVKDHINIHPNVLHIWRKHDFAMPMPPKIFV